MTEQPSGKRQAADKGDRPAANADRKIITLDGADGSSFECELLDIVTLDDREYGLLLKLSGPGEAPENSLVLMRLIQRGDSAIFRTIESDEEFEKVTAFVEELARQHAEG